MLDEHDPDTGPALRLLVDLVLSQNKQVLLWIGAGVSSWCGYPRWDEVADKSILII